MATRSCLQVMLLPGEGRCWSGELGSCEETVEDGRRGPLIPLKALQCHVGVHADERLQSAGTPELTLKQPCLHAGCP